MRWFRTENHKNGIPGCAPAHPVSLAFRSGTRRGRYAVLPLFSLCGYGADGVVLSSRAPRASVCTAGIYASLPPLSARRKPVRSKVRGSICVQRFFVRISTWVRTFKERRHVFHVANPLFPCNLLPRKIQRKIRQTYYAAAEPHGEHTMCVYHLFVSPSSSSSRSTVLDSDTVETEGAGSDGRRVGQGRHIDGRQKRLHVSEEQLAHGWFETPRTGGPRGRPGPRTASKSSWRDGPESLPLR